MKKEIMFTGTCPFCGGEAKILEVYELDNRRRYPIRLRFSAGCTECGLRQSAVKDIDPGGWDELVVVASYDIAFGKNMNFWGPLTKEPEEDV